MCEIAYSLTATFTPHVTCYVWDKPFILAEITLYVKPSHIPSPQTRGSLF